MSRPDMLQLLRVALLLVYLLLPSLLCDNLLCYYSPILHKEVKFDLIVTECPPDELCFKADGRYGNHSALSARGCMPKKKCGLVKSLSLRGTVYTMTFNCCDTPYCNSCADLNAKSLLIAVTLVTVAAMTGSL